MGNQIFAERIKKLRMDKQLSLDGLANALNITKSRVGMWEANGTVPREDTLKNLSQFFEVSIDYLLGNDSMEKKNPDSENLQYLQRGLGKLDEERLKKARKVLTAVFDDIFEDSEGDDDDI